MTEATVYVKYSIYSSIVAGEIYWSDVEVEYFHYEVSVPHGGATLSSLQRFFVRLQDTNFAHHCTPLTAQPVRPETQAPFSLYG
jgi:hypothetical protein